MWLLGAPAPWEESGTRPPDVAPELAARFRTFRPRPSLSLGGLSSLLLLARGALPPPGR